MIRRALKIAGGLLVAFHVWLLVRQGVAGELADAALVARWLAAGGLGAALYGLHRRGESLLRGRRAVAVWLLAALLHGPAMAERTGAIDAPAVPEAVAAFVVSALALTGLLLAAVAGAVGRRQPVALCRVRFAARPAITRSLASLSSLLLAPRPPPRAVRSTIR